MARKSAKEEVKATFSAFWALLLPVIIIGGLRGGIFTPTEAASVAAFYALFVGLVIYRELKINQLYEVTCSCSKNNKCRYAIGRRCNGIELVNYSCQYTWPISSILQPLMGNQTLLLIVIDIIVLIVGTSMDVTPTILILTPVLMPVIIHAGIDPVYFGILFVLTICIGLLTPPVGTVLNVAAGVGKSQWTIL